MKKTVIKLSLVLTATFMGLSTSSGVYADGTPKMWQQVSTLLADERAVIHQASTNKLTVLGVASKPPLRKADAMKSIKVASAAKSTSTTKGYSNSEWRCLTEALYFEARGETLSGQYAVAEVILNRRDSKKFPNSVCAVIGQGASSGKKYACQFSYKCDGRAEVFAEGKAYNQVGKVARQMLNGKKRTLTHGATFYHTGAVRPSWSRKFKRTAKVGQHYFYRG